MVFPGFAPTLAQVPDEVLVMILEAHDAKYEARCVARRIRQVAERSFRVKHFAPPTANAFSIDFEIDHQFAKHLYCAQFGGAYSKTKAYGGSRCGVSGGVTFMNWVPAYWRGSPKSNRDTHHLLSEQDACKLWKIIAKVRGSEERTGPLVGHLCVDEGRGGEGCRREVIGRVSASEAELVLNVLDYRKNTGAEAEQVAAA
mmetsp:Transcript_34446/g.75242  ORF Transcript_34446/g.75242 Transcript_34446/m.75242 type:complete len:200 (+) Transcript_34446:138-737(+)